MPTSEQRPRDRRWRRYFRRCRIALLLGALALVGALTYLNQVGLPEFLRRPLLEKLRDRGLDLQLSALRLHFYRGIVAENVHWKNSSAANPGSTWTSPAPPSSTRPNRFSMPGGAERMCGRWWKWRGKAESE